MGWWYLSFAGPERFHGGAIVEAEGLIEAVLTTHRLGINPGGEVLGHGMPSRMLPPESDRNRLLTSEDLRRIWPDSKSLAEHYADYAEQLAKEAN